MAGGGGDWKECWGMELGGGGGLCMGPGATQRKGEATP